MKTLICVARFLGSLAMVLSAGCGFLESSVYCPNGTAALSCEVDADDYYVAGDGTIYFLSRGAIRMVDAEGKVRDDLTT